VWIRVHTLRGSARVIRTSLRSKRNKGSCCRNAFCSLAVISAAIFVFAIETFFSVGVGAVGAVGAAFIAAFFGGSFAPGSLAVTVVVDVAFPQRYPLDHFTKDVCKIPSGVSSISKKLLVTCFIVSRTRAIVSGLGLACMCRLPPALALFEIFTVCLIRGNP